MATIDLVKIKLNGDTGGGGKPATLESLFVSENGVYVPSEGVDGYNQVNVNVTTPIETFIVPNGVKFGSSSFVEIPDYLDFSNVTDGKSLFYDCPNLKNINNADFSSIENTNNMFFDCAFENFNTYFPNATNIEYLLQSCKKLTDVEMEFSPKTTSINSIFRNCNNLINVSISNTEHITKMEDVFAYCTSLEKVPYFAMDNVTTAKTMFYNCSKITTIPSLNFSNVKDVGNLFYGCTKLESLPLLDFSNVTSFGNYFFGTSNITTLTDLAGFKNLKIDWNDNYGLYKLPNLTYQSVMNVINNLYDFRGNGDTTTRTIKFNANSIALLSDADIAIATNKGWVIS